MSLGQDIWAGYDESKRRDYFDEGASLARRQVIGAWYVDPIEHFEIRNMLSMSKSYFM